MNIGPDADPMTAFRELFGQFNGGQGGGSAPGAGKITSQPLAPPSDGGQPAPPAAQSVDAGYNPLDEMTSDSLTNERAWHAQHMNAPESPAPMGKRPSGAKGIQQSPGTTQPTQSQAPVPGNKPPQTPQPGATAATVASSPELDGGGGQIPPVAKASSFGGGGYNKGPAISVDPGQPGLRGGQAPNAHGFQNGIRDIIARMMQGGQNVAEFLQPGFTTGKPMMPPGGSQSTQPQMPPEMLMQLLADRQRNGNTQGNTPIR